MKTENTDIKSVVLYARVSTAKQADNDLSLPAQLKHLREYARKNGWTIVKEYIEEAKSARTDNRPDFLSMMGLARDKAVRFDAILVWKFSRFARNREDSIMWKATLRRLGVQVISINEPNDRTPMGKVYEGFIEIMDEMYSMQVSHDTYRNMVENAERGNFNGGCPNYGYKPVRTDGGKPHLQIVESEAAVVKEMFRMALLGHGAKEIASALNEKRFTTRKGNSWAKGSILNILKNPIYAGYYVWNRKTKSEYIKDFGVIANQITKENAHPAIITPEEQAKVIELLHSRTPKTIHPREVASEFLLSGLLRCGRCGSKMIGTLAKSGRYQYYACQRYIKEGKASCAQSLIPTLSLEAQFIEAIKAKLLNPEAIGRLTQQVNEQLKVTGDKTKTEIENVDAQLRELHKKLNKYYGLIESQNAGNAGINYTTFSDRINELNSIKDQLLAQRSRLIRQSESCGVLRLTPDAVTIYVENLHRTLKLSNFASRKAFLRSFIKRITLQDDHVDVEYNATFLAQKQKEPLKLGVLSMDKNGSPGWTRTNSPAINSRMLHH